MSVTFAVLKPLRSSDVSLVQPANIYPMLVTSLVFRFPIPMMVVRLEQPLNQ